MALRLHLSEVVSHLGYNITSSFNSSPNLDLTKITFINISRLQRSTSKINNLVAHLWPWYLADSVSARWYNNLMQEIYSSEIQTNVTTFKSTEDFDIDLHCVQVWQLYIYTWWTCKIGTQKICINNQLESPIYVKKFNGEQIWPWYKGQGQIKHFQCYMTCYVQLILAR